ncbi:MAG TPA: YezD family protein [Allosphingosinicella sp.]
MTHPAGAAVSAQPDDALAAIRDYLLKLRFGSIEITVHDGRIVQLDVTEKRRLAR